MNTHEKINYVEFPSKNIENTKRFFIEAFGWSFEDFGSEYSAFSDEGIDGGFYKADLCSSSSVGSALIVFFSQNIEDTKAKIEKAGGKINKEIFSFPGGRRFHFCEPSGNEFAVWTDIK